MALIDQNVTPIELTIEQKKAQAKVRLKKMSMQMYRMMASRHQEMFEIIWNNKNGLTPQEVLDEFGVEAIELFTFSSNIQALLAQADVDYTPLDTPNEYVLNPDGTVTIGAAK